MMLAAHIHVLVRWLEIFGTWWHNSNTFFGWTISIVVAPSPNYPNRSLNCTAMALLQLCSDSDRFLGYPTFDALKQRLPVVAQRLRDSFLGLCDTTKTLVQGAIEAKDVRAPLDYKRTIVYSLQCKPFFLDLTAGLEPHLVALAHLFVEMQQQSNKVLPILVDENMHYRSVR